VWLRVAAAAGRVEYHSIRITCALFQSFIHLLSDHHLSAHGADARSARESVRHVAEQALLLVLDRLLLLLERLLSTLVKESMRENTMGV
jgi:hypothetical protein